MLKLLFVNCFVNCQLYREPISKFPTFVLMKIISPCKLLFISLFIPLLSWGQTAKDTLAEKYASEINVSDLSEYLHIIASDSMEGRATGEKGQKEAARYLASKFKEFGVAPGVKGLEEGSYFQKFELEKKEWQDVYLNVGKDRKVFLEDFYAYGDLEFPEETQADVIFAGYGIETGNYSDYVDPVTKEPLDVKDKFVILLPGEPIQNGQSLITGDSSFSSWANDWRRKVSLAQSKGAKAILMVVGKTYKDFTLSRDRLKEHLAKPSLGFTYKDRPGTFFISIDLAAETLGTSTKVFSDEIEKRKKILAGDSKKRLKNFKPVSLTVKCSIKKSIIQTENVLGFIEGTDKKEEVIVLTAHYDHLGIEGDKICYGADDDGSGTVALLELAQAFAQAKKEGHGPRRSILIMPVTAEEKGLMGSEYYSDHPVYPLENTIANLNIDMIGRLDKAHKDNPDYIYLIGTNRLSTELHDISEKANSTYVNLQLDYTFNSFNDPNRFYYRSDHYNFAKHNIPVIFYFNGVHEDYHKPTDTVDKIIFPKVEKITRLIFYTAWELANRENRIKVDVKEE